MFSGIIRFKGELVVREVSKDNKSFGVTVDISSELFNPLKSKDNVNIGDSIAVDGVCLTVTSFSENTASFFLSNETIEKSKFSNLINLGKRKLIVHLEPSLRVGDTIDGHFVYGHVDTTCELREVERFGESWKFIFKVGSSFYPYLAPKGSVSLNGVSLTIGECELINEKVHFSVYIIPHTFNETEFRNYKAGDILNLEIDPLSRYLVHANSYFKTLK